METHITFMINPVAGRGKAQKVWRRLEKQVPAVIASPLKWDAVFTEAPGHAYELARQISREQMETQGVRRVVVAVGGDGTANEVANGLLAEKATHVAMSAIPAGTGSDFSRGAGMSPDPQASLTALASAAKAWAIDPLDVFLLTDAAGYARHVVNSIGIGFDACVAQIAHASPWLKRLGFISYAVGVLGALVAYEPANIRIAVETPQAARDEEGREWSGEARSSGGNGSVREALPTGKSVPAGASEVKRAWLTTISNTSRYAGGMRVCPRAVPRDGIIDACTLNGVRRAALPYLVLLSFRGAHVGRPGVSFFRGTRVHIDSDGKIPIHVDGDPIEVKLPLTVEVLPGALPFIGAPQGPSAV